MVLFMAVMHALPGCWAKLYGNRTTLRGHLLAKYDPANLPRHDASLVSVNISTYVLYLLGTDVVRGSAEYLVAVNMTWIDELLVWNPEDYYGIEDVVFKQQDIWYPDITTVSSTDLSRFPDTGKVRVNYKGIVSLFVSHRIESVCIFNLRHWPFDKQTCLIAFALDDYSSSEVAFNTLPDGFVYASKNSEWDLDLHLYSISGSRSDHKSQAVYYVRFERRPYFYLLCIIAPIISLMVMNTFVFLLPPESGERVGFSLTLMLATAVFLSIITDEIPKASDPLPLICVYVLIGVLMCIFTTIVLSLNLRFYFRRPEIKVNSFYRGLVRCTLSSNHTRLENGRKYTFNAANVTGDKDAVSQRSNDPADVPPECLRDNVGRSPCQEATCTWQEVGAALDSVMFVVFFTATLIGSVAAICYLRDASQFLDNLYSDDLS